jgi:polysaccharide biosynthesis protein PslH
MKKVLFLTARVPAPLDDGWKIRTFHLIQGYARNGWQVDLLSLCSSKEMDQVFPELHAICHKIKLIPRTKSYSPADLLKGLVFSTPFQVYNYKVSAMADAARNLFEQNRYDIIQIEDVVMAQYLNEQMDDTFKVLDMHNVESSLLLRYAEKEENIFKKTYARLSASKLDKYETLVSKNFSMILTCSSEDLALLRKIGITTPAQVVPNGVDCDYFSPMPFDSSSRNLVFVGSMDYHANISGVHFFVQDILPLILRKYPDTHFYIVGKNPPESVRNLTSKNITVTGKVSDVREYLRKARVVVVPLLVGGGTRLKILEAMACSRPMVSTSLGAEGIAAVHGEHLMLADEPSKFVKSVLMLLNDIDFYIKITSSSKKLVNTNYSWTAIQDKFLYHINRQLQMFGNS